MRYVIVPEPVILLDAAGKPMKEQDQKKDAEAITMHSFLLSVPCSNPAIGSGPIGLRRVNKLDKLFDDVAPGTEVEVEDADHAAVQKILEETTWGYPQIARQQIRFLDAWEFATRESRDNEAGGEPKQKLKSVDKGKK